MELLSRELGYYLAYPLEVNRTTMENFIKSIITNTAVTITLKHHWQLGICDLDAVK